MEPNNDAFQVRNLLIPFFGGVPFPGEACCQLWFRVAFSVFFFKTFGAFRPIFRCKLAVSFRECKGNVDFQLSGWESGSRYCSWKMNGWSLPRRIITLFFFGGGDSLHHFHKFHLKSLGVQPQILFCQGFVSRIDWYVGMRLAHFVCNSVG